MVSALSADTEGITRPPGDAESLLASATKAQEVNGDLSGSRRWFEAAYREAERAGDEALMARAALGLCGLWVHEQRTLVGSSLIETRLQRALALTDPESTLALRLRIRAASEADYRRGEHAAVLAVLDEARASPDPVARIEALSQAHHCLLGPDHGTLRLALADEMVGLAANAGHRGHLRMGMLWLVADLFLTADRHVERRVSELRELLADHDHLAVGYVLKAIDVMLAIRAGRLADAERLATDCLEYGRMVGDADADGWFGAHLGAIRWYQGRLPELLPFLTDLVSSPTLSAIDHSFTAACAVAAAQSGDSLTAARALAVVRGQGLAELPRSSSWLVTMGIVVEAAHLLGDASTAAEAYELLKPFAELPMMASLAIACFGSVHHALGVACLTTGDLDNAVAHLTAAVDRNVALGHWPAVVASRQRQAQARQRLDAATLAGSLAADAAGPPPAGAVRCTRHGVKWRLALDSATALVDHSVGMLHLAVLIANPGQEIAAIDLVAGLDGLAQAASKSATTQPVLDRAAARQYRRRLAELTGQGNENAEAEREWLLAELGAATGPGGRSRAFTDSAERARIAVGRSIRRALAAIERADDAIGTHLRATVHTGAKCWYRPA